MSAEDNAVNRYFNAADSALSGLDMYLREDDTGLGRHDVVGSVMVGYLKRLSNSFDCWKDQVSLTEKFRISRAESGFPVFQNVLNLENEQKTAKARLAALPDEQTVREEMVDFILRKKKFPTNLQNTIAKRRFLETVQSGEHFSKFVMPETVRVSVNPKTKRPYYIVHWGVFDGSSNIPLVYMALIEDSSEKMFDALVGKDGKLYLEAGISLPVEGLLNPDLAHQFDEFAEKNSTYGLTLSTIATNLDHDFDNLHPKQLRRFVLGPFYHAGTTQHGSKVEKILDRVNNDRHAWLMTWTQQEIFSTHEKPAKRGFWSSDPARDEFYINTDDLECARQGVSSFQRNALVPHEAYQAIYAAGEQNAIFDGYETHVISGNQILRNM